MNTLVYQLDTGAYLPVYSAGMDWATLRAAYRASFLEAKKKGATQESVAKRGGLKDQNAISRLMANNKLGPQAETFVRAIEGLGIKPSEFFLHLEVGTSPALPAQGEAATLPAALDHLSHAATAVIVAVGRARQATKPADAVREPRRPGTGRGRRRT